MTVTGLDTVALAFPRQGGADLMTALGARSDQVPAAFGAMLTQPLASGARVLWWAEHGVVKVEGRLSALMAGDRRCWDLAGRDELLQAEDVVRRMLGDLVGAEPTEPAELSRYDLTGERAYPADTGRATLRAMPAFCPPRYIVREYRLPAAGESNSVAFCTMKRGVVAFRTYDKGVESGSHPRGERIRFEAQNHRKAGNRRSPEVVARGDLRADFARTLTPVLEAAEEVVVVSPDSATEHIAGMVARGELTHARADQLAGSITFLRAYGRPFYGDRLARDRLRKLRRAGIALDVELPANATVSMDEELRSLIAEFDGV